MTETAISPADTTQAILQEVAEVMERDAILCELL